MKTLNKRGLVAKLDMGSAVTNLVNVAEAIESLKEDLKKDMRYQTDSMLHLREITLWLRAWMDKISPVLERMTDMDATIERVLSMRNRVDGLARKVARAEKRKR